MIFNSTSSGDPQNTWYGTSSTDAFLQTKVVRTTTGDFVLATGNSVRVKFTNAQMYAGGIKLDVDGTGEVSAMRAGTSVTLQYFFDMGEVIDFVYDGTYFIAVNEGIADTTYYGMTKLSNATNSTSIHLAATPSAVKAAYDLANGKQDALVSGTNIKTINGSSILGSGDLVVGGSADPVDVTGSVSAASASDATICSTAQYDAGVYLVSVYVSFPASSSGRRHIHIAATNAGSAIDNWSQLTLAPSNAQPTIMQLTTIQHRTGTGRWYLRCYQNSGSNQTVSGGIRVLKLHD